MAKYEEPTVENGGLVAGCLCGKTTRECGDCLGMVAHLEKQSGIAPKPEDYDDAPLLCICTEPYSDEARRAGMSWGGVSATISGACPLCQDGCPPECRSLTLTRIEEKLEKALPGLVQAGGWCAPSACGAGICQVNDEHDEDCPEPGWAYKQQASATCVEDLSLPSLVVKRGGIRHARFIINTHIYSRKPHWWNRRTWHLRVQTWNGEEYVTSVLDLDSKERAEAAELQVKLVVKNINENYFKELDDRAR